MVEITLPTFADFIFARGSVKVTKVVQAHRQYGNQDDHKQVDHYIHLRRPLMRALLAGGDPAPLAECLTTLQDPKKYQSHAAIVEGLTRVFARHEFEGHAVSKRLWRHADLTVSVTPQARLRMDDGWHVAYVHLKKEELDARAVAPMLELLSVTHGHLGEPLVIEARTGKLYRPSPSPSIRRGLRSLLEGEAESFVRQYRGIEDVA